LSHWAECGRDICTCAMSQEEAYLGKVQQSVHIWMCLSEVCQHKIPSYGPACLHCLTLREQVRTSVDYTAGREVSACSARIDEP
jgi:hypothetical protein